MALFNIKIPREIIPILIILMAFVTNGILQIIIKIVFNPNKVSKKHSPKKVKTLRSLFGNFAKYVVWIVAFFALLAYLGVNMAAIITGLGVVSLVIGLAFQDILKDILVGISIVFEDLFSVGDLVKIGDFQGTVISVGIKTTKIQAYTGEVKMISNRNITEVINYSVDKTLAVVDIPVSYDERIERVEKILMVHAETLRDKIPSLVDDIELLGVEELSDSAVVFRLIGKCKPGCHFEVERQMRKEFKTCLDKNGIKIPYKQIEVHNEK